MNRENKIQELRRKRDNALRNAARQRRKMIEAKRTNKDVRVRPEFWEQVARDYLDEIMKLQFAYVNK